MLEILELGIPLPLVLVFDTVEELPPLTELLAPVPSCLHLGDLRIPVLIWPLIVHHQELSLRIDCCNDLSNSQVNGLIPPIINIARFLHLIGDAHKITISLCINGDLFDLFIVKIEFFGELEKFEKEAVVSDKSWMETVVKISDKIFPSVDVKHFSFDEKDDALVWRGSHIGKTIEQFWQEVVWGQLDYLLVDLPPGTADASLTVMESFPLSGVIVSFTPQDLTSMVARKVVKMAQIMKVPVLGVVENMSYFLLPATGERIEIFGKSKGDEMAEAARAPLLGQLPLDPELAKSCDEGDIEHYDSDAFAAFAQASLQVLRTLWRVAK